MSTDVLSQAAVESEILRLCGLAERATTELAKRARASAEADGAYKAGHAKAFLRADGSVQARTATADVECEDLYLLRRIAEGALMASQEAGRNYRTQLDSLRSINANLRSLVGA